MRVLLVLLLVGIVSRSEGYSYGDRDHYSGEWNHGESSHEDSEGFQGSPAALAEDSGPRALELDPNYVEPVEPEEDTGPHNLTFGSVYVTAEPEQDYSPLNVTVGKIYATEEPEQDYSPLNVTVGKIHATEEPEENLEGILNWNKGYTTETEEPKSDIKIGTING